MEQLYLWEQVCVIMKWIDLLLYPWVTYKKTKIRKNKIIIFYSFLILTFSFSLLVVQRSLCIFDFYLWSKSPQVFYSYLWYKSPYVFFTFTYGPFSCDPKGVMYFWLLLLAFFKCLCGHHLWSFISIQSTSS